MPDRKRCSVCSTTIKPFKYETRPTGAHGELQRWPYCASCYDQFVTVRPEEDLETELVELVGAAMVDSH
jgi:hypothetical protein